MLWYKIFMAIGRSLELKMTERNNIETEKLDRLTALRVLQDISSKMYPDVNLFGQKTLVIRREDFEKIRAKYLDEEDG